MEAMISSENTKSESTAYRNSICLYLKLTRGRAKRSCMAALLQWENGRVNCAEKNIQDVKR